MKCNCINGHDSSCGDGRQSIAIAELDTLKTKADKLDGAMLILNGVKDSLRHNRPFDTKSIINICKKGT
jgi:hypothetical protein